MTDNWLRLGEPADFAALRSLMEQAGYTETAVFDGYGADGPMKLFEQTFNTEPRPVEDPFDLLCQLFLEGHEVPEAEATKFWDAGKLTLLERLGLLERTGAGVLLATACLAPANELFLAGDRWHDPDRNKSCFRDDAVYPAYRFETREFMKWLPDRPCRRLLDMGTGNGIIGLWASRFADQVVGVDIAERAVHVARFNTLLNAKEGQVDIRLGDLAETVQGEQFDQIIAHLPYRPVLENKLVCTDGGVDGEELLRRFLQSVPDLLAPGGRFCASCLLSDRKGSTAEERLRAMLGQRQGEFDLAIVSRTKLDLAAWRDKSVEWATAIAELGIEQWFVASIVLQRPAAERPVFTTRREGADHTYREEVEWLLAWEEWRRSPGAVESLAYQALMTPPGTKIHTVFASDGENWALSDFQLESSHPYEVVARGEGFLLSLMQHAHGAQTVKQHIQRLRQGGFLPDEVQTNDVLQRIADLIGLGLLETPAHRVPRLRLPE